MTTWENLPILIALPLAVAAALMSGGHQARRDMTMFLTDAFKPQAADLGGDSGYLLGTDVETVWSLPLRPVAIAP